MRSVPLCPHCASSQESPVTCERCGWRWYPNTLPAAGALVERIGPAGEPEALLLRRAVSPGRGGWDLPAGYLEPHETAERAARRETREESGLEVELVRLLGVYSSPIGNAVSSVYLARPRDPAAVVVLDSESDDHAWVARGEVAAWLSRMAFPAMAAALSDWAEGRDGLVRGW